MRPTLSLAAALAAAPALTLARPACPQWTPSGPYPGLNDDVTALTTWDPDGPGPRSPLLIAAGLFTHAGAFPARTVAAWNGVEWRPLAAECPLSGYIFALATYQSDLILAGASEASPPTNPPRRILRFNGVDWLPLSEAPDPPGAISSLVVRGNDIFAAGQFDYPITIPPTHSSDIVHFGGKEWSQLPLGHADGALLTPIPPIAIYQTDLVTAVLIERPNTFPSDRGIARWDGQSWTLLPEQLAPQMIEARALLADGDDLYVGGAVEAPNSSYAHAVRKWDGTRWTSIGPPEGAWDTSYLRSLNILNGTLYASGSLRTNSDSSILYLWNGAEWIAAPGFQFGLAMAAAVFENQLVTAGSFPIAATPPAFGNIAAWDATHWTALGEGVREYVSAFATYDGSLIAAGAFESTGLAIAHLARWDGDRWTPFVTQTDGIPSALGIWNNDLVVAGAFDGSPARYAARWSGSLWTPMDNGFNSLATEYLAYLHTMTVWNGDLYASRQLYSLTTGLPPDPPLPNLMRWSFDHWQEVGPPPAPDAQPIIDLVGFGERLIALTHHDVSAWDGQQWTSLIPQSPSANTPSGFFSDLYVFDGALWLAGAFNSLPSSAVAKWDGTNWTLLPPGPNTLSSTQLGSYNGMLRYGDAFWNGQAWRHLPTGFDPPHITLTNSVTHDGQLFLTGAYVFAGGQPSAYLARYRNALGDANNDHLTNFLDLVLVLSNYARSGDPGSIPGDCNNDGEVDMLDLNDVLTAFGQSCPPAP